MSDQQKPARGGSVQAAGTHTTPTDDLLARLHDLLDAFWPAAASGDVKAGELVRRILGQQADLYGLRGKVAMPAADDTVDELAKLRARRAAP